MDIGGYSGYANEASQINQNLWDFRTDTNAIRSANKQLLQQSKTNDMLNVLKDVGQEVTLKTFQDLAGKYGGKAYRYKSSVFGNNSIADLDAKLGENIVDRVGEMKNAVGAGLTNFKNRILLPKNTYDLGSQKISLKDLGQGYDNLSQNLHSVHSGLGVDESSHEASMASELSEWQGSNPDSHISDESFETFLARRTQQVERNSDGEIVFNGQDTDTPRIVKENNRDMPDTEDLIGHHREEIGGDTALSGQARSDTESMNRYQSALEDVDHSDYIRSKGDIALGDESLIGGVEEVAGHSGVESATTAAGSDAEKFLDGLEKVQIFGGEGLEGVGLGIFGATRAGAAVGARAGSEVAEEAVSGIAKGAARGAAEEAAGTAIEGVGAALDSTGVFAPLGFLFNALGGALDVAGAVQTGIGVEHFVEEDVLQKAPSRMTPSVSLPIAPQTIAQRGFGITPNYDSLNYPSSVSSSW